tara:strand:- start:104 stop:673 length:570 start_codon:yes stop_codon:yes gene_type:complete
MLAKSSLIYSVFFLLSTKSLQSAEGMPQFASESFPSQLFWLVLTFTSLYIFISFVILPRIRSNLRLRKNKISNDLDRAESIKNETEKIIEDYNKKIEDAKEKAHNQLKNSLKKANDELIVKLSELREQTDKKLKNAEKEIMSYKEKIEKEIDTTANNISEIILSKILNEGYNMHDINNIIKKSTSYSES